MAPKQKGGCLDTLDTPFIRHRTYQHLTCQKLNYCPISRLYTGLQNSSY